MSTCRRFMRFFCVVFLIGLFPLQVNAGSASTDCAETWEIQVAHRLNDIRAANGLSRLSISDTLSASAEHMVQDMARYGYNGHYLHNGTKWSDNQRNHGYTYNTYRGQNVAAGQDTPELVVAAWMNSPAHKANILNPNYKVIGVGYTSRAGTSYGTFWTTDFGGYVDSKVDRC